MPVSCLCHKTYFCLKYDLLIVIISLTVPASCYFLCFSSALVLVLCNYASFILTILFMFMSLSESALLLTVVFNNYLAFVFTDILCNSTQIQERVYLPLLCYTLVLSSATMEPSPKELRLCGYQSVLRLFHHSNHPRQLCFSRHAKFTSCRHCRVSIF